MSLKYFLSFFGCFFISLHSNFFFSHTKIKSLLPTSLFFFEARSVFLPCPDEPQTQDPPTTASWMLESQSTPLSLASNSGTHSLIQSHGDCHRGCFLGVSWTPVSAACGVPSCHGALWYRACFLCVVYNKHLTHVCRCEWVVTSLAWLWTPKPTHPVLITETSAGLGLGTAVDHMSPGLGLQKWADAHGGQEEGKHKAFSAVATGLTPEGKLQIYAAPWRLSKISASKGHL